MKALILNSGLGSRMGTYTTNHPKCMTELIGNQTILSKQLTQLENLGIKDVIITTGYYNKVLVDYIESLNLNLNYTFVNNTKYNTTNYIYSIFLAREYLKDDILLMHGDLVFDDLVLKDIYNYKKSCMVTSSSLELPQKDFKAVINNMRIDKIGINFFTNANAAQPLYKLLKKDWTTWLDKIEDFCKNDKVSCYAENAFNEISNECEIFPFDIKDRLCSEIDTPEDLKKIKNILKSL